MSSQLVLGLFAGIYVIATMLLTARFLLLFDDSDTADKGNEDWNG